MKTNAQLWDISPFHVKVYWLKALGVSAGIREMHANRSFEDLTPLCRQAVNDTPKTVMLKAGVEVDA